MGRDRKYQAILPAQGQNPHAKKRVTTRCWATKNSRHHHRAGYRHRKDDFHAGKLRYHKVILMTDADVDGSHIRTLAADVFFRLMKDRSSAGTSTSRAAALRVKRARRKNTSRRTDLRAS